MDIETKKTQKRTSLSKTTPFVLLGFLVALIIGSSSPALAFSLGTAGEYNAFIFGDFTSVHSDVEGRLAAGGDVTLTEGYSVGHGLATDTTATTDALVAGGNLIYDQGEVWNGNVRVAGTASTRSGFKVRDGSLYQGETLSIDFTAEKTYLTGLSTQLAEMDATGTVTISGSELSLSGDGVSDLVIFDIDGLLLSSISTYTISSIADGATVIINVSGMDISMENAGMWSDLDGSSVLFNFYQAESLTMSGISINASILAVSADIQADNGQLNGTVIAESWDGTMELHNVTFESSAAVPVPGSFLIITIGLIALVGWKRHFDYK